MFVHAFLFINADINFFNRDFFVWQNMHAKMSGLTNTTGLRTVFLHAFLFIEADNFFNQGFLSGKTCALLFPPDQDFDIFWQFNVTLRMSKHESTLAIIKFYACSNLAEFILNFYI